jgi:hypothetical protein
MNSESPSVAGNRRSRLFLVILMGLFFAPLLVAWLLFHVFPDWRPEGTVNRGQLVEPPRPLPAFQLPDIDGALLDETLFRGKWTLLTITRGACAEDCVRRLYNMRQIRLAQGKNMDRLQRLMLWVRPERDTGAGPELAAKFPGQQLIPVDRQRDGGLVDAFAIDAIDPLDADRMYLIDPLGNLMMSYEPDADPRDAIKDLERLLKYSGLG